MSAAGAKAHVNYVFISLHVPPSARSAGYFLQPHKKGATYTGYERTDGKRWKKVYSYYSCPAAPTGIGLLALNGATSSAPPILANFDFFQERPLPAGTPGPLPVAP
jgi:hypothetical protein